MAKIGISKLRKLTQTQPNISLKLCKIEKFTFLQHFIDSFIFILLSVSWHLIYYETRYFSNLFVQVNRLQVKNTNLLSSLQGISVSFKGHLVLPFGSTWIKVWDLSRSHQLCQIFSYMIIPFCFWINKPIANLLSFDEWVYLKVRYVSFL